jgi:hypothetical protein
MALIGWSANAHAQSAEAEALFRDARALIHRGQLAAACEKFAASAQLEPSVGTLLNLGDCREKLGKLASAWAAFRKAESMSKRSGGDGRREAESRRRATALEPRLSRLVIAVPTGLAQLVVRRDDEVIEPAVWNTPVPIDPGSYTISAEAPGYIPWRRTVVIDAKAELQTVQLPALDPRPISSVTLPIAVPEPPPITYVTTRRARTWSATRELSVGLGIAGAAAVGTGVYFGMRSNELRNRADASCPATTCSDSGALHDNARAQTDATRANILYAAGGAGVATALVLWLAGAPSDETRVRPMFGDHEAGMSLTGSF